MWKRFISALCLISKFGTNLRHLIWVWRVVWATRWTRPASRHQAQHPHNQSWACISNLPRHRITRRNHTSKTTPALLSAATCHLNAALTLSSVLSLAAVTSPPSLLSCLSIAANTCHPRTCGECIKWLPGGRRRLKAVPAIKLASHHSGKSSNNNNNSHKNAHPNGRWKGWCFFFFFLPNWTFSIERHLARRKARSRKRSSYPGGNDETTAVKMSVNEGNTKRQWMKSEICFLSNLGEEQKWKW